MADSFIDTTRLDHIIAYFRKIEGLDPTPMLKDWEKIIIEDNRAGLLNGENKDGQIVTPPLKYRNGSGTWTAHRQGRFAQQRSRGLIGGHAGVGYDTIRFKSKDGIYRPTHRGGQAGLANNNLSTSQYKKLTGPYGIPRGIHSRLITNFAVKIPLAARQVDVGSRRRMARHR